MQYFYTDVTVHIFTSHLSSKLSIREILRSQTAPKRLLGFAVNRSYTKYHSNVSGK